MDRVIRELRESAWISYLAHHAFFPLREQSHPAYDIYKRHAGDLLRLYDDGSWSFSAHEGSNVEHTGNTLDEFKDYWEKGIGIDRHPRNGNHLTQTIEELAAAHFSYNPVVKVTKIGPRAVRVFVRGNTPSGSRSFRIEVKEERK
jgi:hypothetical protein